MMDRSGRYVLNTWHVSGHIPLVASQCSDPDSDVSPAWFVRVDETLRPLRCMQTHRRYTFWSKTCKRFNSLPYTYVQPCNICVVSLHRLLGLKERREGNLQKESNHERTQKGLTKARRKRKKERKKERKKVKRKYERKNLKERKKKATKQKNEWT